MEQNYNEIILKAKEISHLINTHEITLKYRETLSKLQKEPKAHKLLQELVRIGGELTDQANRDGSFSNISPTENQLLQKELNENPIVKEHLLAQKNYLNLLNMVTEKIKDPD